MGDKIPQLLIPPIPTVLILGYDTSPCDTFSSYKQNEECCLAIFLFVKHCHNLHFHFSPEAGEEPASYGIILYCIGNLVYQIIFHWHHPPPLRVCMGRGLASDHAHYLENKRCDTGSCESMRFDCNVINWSTVTNVPSSMLCGDL